MFIGPWGKLTYLHFPLIFNFQSPTFPDSTFSYPAFPTFRKYETFLAVLRVSWRGRLHTTVPRKTVVCRKLPPPTPRNFSNPNWGAKMAIKMKQISLYIIYYVSLFVLFVCLFVCFFLFEGVRQQEVKKAIGLDWQNNNSARAPRFFAHFFTVTARLRSEKASFHDLRRT